MPAIDVLKIDEKYKSTWQLSIGDRVYTQSSISQTRLDISGTEVPFEVSVDGDELEGEISRCRFSDISTNIGVIGRLTFHLVNHPDLFQLVSIERVSSDATYIVRIGLGFRSHEWKMPWSYSEYKNEFLRVIKQSHTRFEVDMSDPFFDRLITTVDDATNIIEDEISTYSDPLQAIHEEVEALLKARLSTHSVLIYFDFPEEVKVPCEQYLVYFAKFLKDLGVEAETALTNEAGRVLFTVTPIDENQALDSIRSALDLYLHLPSNPIGETTNESIAVLRLEANILRLRGDLKLAAAELQAKNTTIEAQRLIIDVKNAMLSGEILVGSVKDITPQAEDKEQLINGLVALSTYKDKGVEIYLGEVLRRLKKLFSKVK